MEVHPEQLRAIAAKVDEVAAAVRGSVTSRAAALAPAEGRSTGSSAAAAARSAAGAWAGFTGQLGGAVGALGTGLRSAADRYVATDQAAARHADRLRYAV